MAILEKKNQNLMNLIRKVHGVVENVDLEKHRQSQDHFGVLLGSSKEVYIREFEIEGIHGEWTSVNRAHMKKYIILYCHGGCY
ncbi:MAG: alpha/beta hydrolase, partial [Lachnospiraceae bacterium]|nr:alpha/beta hydrolase [Lachnospiraceae bacterium]